MDFASFGIAGVACITVICYLAATACLLYTSDAADEL